MPSSSSSTTQSQQSQQQRHSYASSRIAFGACNDQDRQNDLWEVILQRNPAAFVWAGDAIYADIQHPIDWSQFPPSSYLECATPERLHQLYRRQLSVPGYRQLLQHNVTIFGTLDDHDYGCNNADRNYPYKYESGKAFVDFLGYSNDSFMARRAAAGHGVYGVKLFDFAQFPAEVPDRLAQLDPEYTPVVVSSTTTSTTTSSSSTTANASNKTVAVFVLDVRTHKTPWKTGPDAFRPDIEGDFLGERQWRWLEMALRRSRAHVNVIVTGLQVHADRFPDGNVAEAWGKYPVAQQRLFDAILQSNVQAPILISGDVHMTQLMRKDCMPSSSDSTTRHMRSLMELTTSGMTHSWATISRPLDSEPDYQFDLVQRYKTLLAGSLMRLLHWTCPWRDLMVSSVTPTDTASATTSTLYENGGGENATRGLQFSLSKNFGELEFDWEERTVTMRSLGEDAQPLLMARMSIDQLSGAAHIPGSRLTPADFENEKRHRLVKQGEWICINHRGRVNQLSHIMGHVTAGAVLTTLVPFPFLLPTYVMVVLIRRVLRNSSVEPQKLASRRQK